MKSRITKKDLDHAVARFNHVVKFRRFYFTIGAGLYRLSLETSHHVLLLGTSKREIYEKIHAFCDGFETARRLENGENL